MEAYRTKCKTETCGFDRTWIGYKTGLGKSPEQLAQMKKHQTTCIKCGGSAETRLDERGLINAMEARAEALRKIDEQKVLLQY